METHLLEINLISAQGLKPPSSNLRRMQTYALAWIDSSTKLQTRLDKIGGENPTWNDKFVFRVSADFLSRETSAVSVEIYAVGYLKDPLIGTVRFLLSNFLPSAAKAVATRTPSCTALQIRRPSGRFHGVFNVGAMVIDGSEFSALTGRSAIGYRDLMGEDPRRKPRHRRGRTYSSGESCRGSMDFSESADSTTSSSSSTSTVLKEWNGVRERAGKGSKSNGGSFLCGLVHQKKNHLSPLDQNNHDLTLSDHQKI